MSGSAFEDYLAILLANRGYVVKKVGRAGDQGVDLIVTKDGKQTAVQAKRHSRPVNNAAVQEVVAGRAMYQCTEAMVISTNYFNDSARELAKANQCVLVDRDKLTSWIQDFQSAAKRWTSIQEKP